MRKETLVTAVVFLVVGFLAGYFVEGQRKATLPAASAPQAAATPQDSPSNADSSMALPPGHPPINSSGESEGLPPGHPPITGAAVTEYLSQLAAQHPGNAKITAQLANAYYDQQQYAPAAEWYQKTLALDPSNADARTDMGTAEFMLGHPHQALRDYHQALATDPKHKVSLLDSVIVDLDGLHDAKAARRDLAKLRVLDPSNPHIAELAKAIAAAGSSK